MDMNPIRITVTAPDFNPLPLVFLLLKSSLFLHPASHKKCSLMRFITLIPSTSDWYNCTHASYKQASACMPVCQGQREREGGLGKSVCVRERERERVCVHA